MTRVSYSYVGSNSLHRVYCSAQHEFHPSVTAFTLQRVLSHRIYVTHWSLHLYITCCSSDTLLCTYSGRLHGVRVACYPPCVRANDNRDWHTAAVTCHAPLRNTLHFSSQSSSSSSLLSQWQQARLSLSYSSVCLPCKAQHGNPLPALCLPRVSVCICCCASLFTPLHILQDRLSFSCRGVSFPCIR